MTKAKPVRKHIILECTICRNNIFSRGVSRYLTSKNKRNTIKKLELLKYCKYCKKHTLHKEIK